MPQYFRPPPGRRGALVLGVLCATLVGTTLFPAPEAGANDPNTVFLFAAPYSSDSFVWCFDRQFSPVELEFLKLAIVACIQQLSPDQEFGLTAFSPTTVWSPVPLAATDANKASAMAWLDNLESSGPACNEAALLASLDVLGQGAGSDPALIVVGKVTPCGNHPQILANVAAANTEDVPIHCVYFNTDSAGISFYQALNTASFNLITGPPGPTHVFLRGDANGDGQVSGLSDALFVLNYQFIPGSPEPLCLRAADADGDDTISGIADALAILNYQFVPGSPPPPAPGPSCCGFALSLLTCDQQPACP